MRSPLRLSLCSVLFASLLAWSACAQAEDCWNGPSNITSQLKELATLTTPVGGSMSLKFAFNALWEDELFVCDGQTHQILATRGNTRERADWNSPAAPAGQTHDYVLAAFNKTVSASAGDAGSHPWLQMSLKNLTAKPESRPQVEQYGFSDGAVRDHRDDNILVTVNYNGDRNPAPTVTLTVTPMFIAPGASATLQWTSQNTSACIASGDSEWSGGKPTGGSLQVHPKLAGAKTYKLTCKGNSPQQSASATATLNVGNGGRKRIMIVPQ
jgi:hypothetical protein